MADHQTGIRLPTSAIARADALAAALADDPQLSAMGPVTRSGVLRLAIALGLDVLEGRTPAPQRAKAKTRTGGEP